MTGLDLDNLLRSQPAIPLTDCSEDVSPNTFEEWVEIHGEPEYLGEVSPTFTEGIRIVDCESEEEPIDTSDIIYEDKKGNPQLNYKRFVDVFAKINNCVYCNGVFFNPDGAISNQAIRRDIANSLGEAGWSGRIDTPTNSIFQTLKDMYSVDELSVNERVIPLANGDLHIGKGEWEFRHGEKMHSPYRLNVNYVPTDKPTMFTEYSKTTTILRDLLNDSFTNIYVNNETIYEECRKYISLISPEQEKIVKLYKDKAPIFDHFEVTRQIKSSFGKVVPIKQGAYLVIEHTEALHVIDVNSGIRSKNKEQEQNTFDINCYAAEEIARQLRLRDMGGIVVVDFIDMESNEHKNALYKKMTELMEGDRAKHNVLPLTKFGLMQITRQRVRPAIEINTQEVCPVCNGTGKIQSSVVIDDAIERRLSYYVTEKKINHLILKVSPILGAYLTKGVFNSILKRWKKKYECKIELEEVTDFTVLQNEFYDEKGGKLD